MKNAGFVRLTEGHYKGPRLSADLGRSFNSACSGAVGTVKGFGKGPDVTFCWTCGMVSALSVVHRLASYQACSLWTWLIVWCHDEMEVGA